MKKHELIRKAEEIGFRVTERGDVYFENDRRRLRLWPDRALMYDDIPFHKSVVLARGYLGAMKKLEDIASISN